MTVAPAPVALVIGAGKNLGAAIAWCFARERPHVAIDGRIESEATRGLFPDVFAARGPDGILQPDEMAGIYWQLHSRPRSAWSFETDVRTSVEPW